MCSVLQRWRSADTAAASGPAGSHEILAPGRAFSSVDRRTQLQCMPRCRCHRRAVRCPRRLNLMAIGPHGIYGDAPRRGVSVTSDALAVSTLERLARLDTQGHPVVSMYVDLDPTRFPTPGARDTQLGSLFDQLRRDGGERETEALEHWLDANPTVKRGARGLALFSCAQAGILEVVRLTRPVEPQAVVDAVPWLEPLAALISPGDWGVAIVGRRAARLFRGGPDGLSEFATIDDDVFRRHAQGGWSQARFQRGIEEQVAAHVRGVAERLLRAHLRQPFEHLVVICSGELRPLIQRSLHNSLTAVVAEIIDADLGYAPANEVAAVVAPVIERVERDREREITGRLEQALGTGGAAAAGLEEVLSALEQERVEALLVGEPSRLRAWRCATCGRLSATGGRCPLDGGVPVEADAVEHAVARAQRQSARVIVARYEPQWLHEHGEIAALLRW